MASAEMSPPPSPPRNALPGARTRRLVSVILILTTLLAPGSLTSAVARTLASPADWSGAWHGTYDCAQGLTGLDLTISPLGPGSVRAVFAFHAIPQNPLLPSGEFVMTGQLGAPGHLTLHAGAWTVQPPFYVTVDLDGTFYPASAEYRGRVIGPGCSSFRLRRDTLA